MDITPPPTALMGPPEKTSPESQTNGSNESAGFGMMEHGNAGSVPGPSAAAAAQAGSQQPKVVQTAFIHKLYKWVTPLCPLPGHESAKGMRLIPISACSKTQQFRT